jgi:imidazolonepropionase-like amidohydrolase
MDRSTRYGATRNVSARLTRREFVQRTATLGTLLAAGCAGGSRQGSTRAWQRPSAEPTLLHHYRLFDGRRTTLIENTALLVDKGVIQKIVHEPDPARYGSYRHVDLHGLTLLPGLIDAHVHLTAPFTYRVTLPAFAQKDEQAEINFRTCVMSGVTTVRDLGSFPRTLLACKEKADRHEIPGPRVVASLAGIAARENGRLGWPEPAPYFTNPLVERLVGGNWAQRPTTPDKVKAACEEIVAMGARWLKSFYQEQPFTYADRTLPNLSDNEYRTLLEVGKKHGIRSALHQPFVNGFAKGVALGFDTLEHMPGDSEIPDTEVDAFVRREMSIVPTLMIYGEAFIAEKLLGTVQNRPRSLLTPEAVRQTLEQYRTALGMIEAGRDSEEYRRLIADYAFLGDRLSTAKANLTKLREAGAGIAVGSDCGGTLVGFFGRFVDELEHYVSAGIAAGEVLRMATSGNARILGLDDSVGSIGPGMRADMAAVKGNPLEDIGVLRDVRMVMKDGVLMRNELSG